MRTLKTDSKPLLLKTNMGAGHGGASGRYDYLRETALDYAFFLTHLASGNDRIKGAHGEKRKGINTEAAEIAEDTEKSKRGMSEPTTPLMMQYHAIKARYPHALLLFRLGDFYELFYEDAIIAARELQITLTSRNREKGQPIPMCGVPYHAAEGYIARLIRAGFKIAICDQMEQPGPGKKLVRREVVRVITPGTATDRRPPRRSRKQFSRIRRQACSGFTYRPRFRRSFDRRISGHRILRHARR